MLIKLVQIVLVILSFWDNARAAEIKLAPLDAACAVVQVDRSVSTIDLADYQSHKLCTADHFAADDKRHCLLTTETIDKLTTRVSLYIWKANEIVLVAQAIVDGEVINVMNAPRDKGQEAPRFCVTLLHSITPGKKWTEVLLVHPSGINGGQSKLGGIMVEPVPALSGLVAQMTVPGVFSEDQSGWFAGSFWASSAALEAHPDLCHKNKSQDLDYPVAFVVTDFVHVRHAWPTVPMYQLAEGDLAFGGVIRFQHGKILTEIDTKTENGKVENNPYYIIDASDGKITPCRFLASAHGKVLSVNKAFDIAAVHSETITDGGKVSWDTRVINTKGQNYDVSHSEANMSSYFHDDVAFITDGHQLWQVLTDGSIIKHPLQ